jgi:hypothetical protein
LDSKIRAKVKFVISDQSFHETGHSSSILPFSLPQEKHSSEIWAAS